ncbi:hypothetical protein P3T76_010461 [Phytophthora citrophthora]|uniref:Uncharacterized protein n=1 Tax=Phytophthora citrophthora TaxID=4793 RepID=A0AAD9LGR3_9STRA|nr:hypothetical protein P3T76_010461 [Phytophthora citrophthora]
MNNKNVSHPALYLRTEYIVFTALPRFSLRSTRRNAVSRDLFIFAFAIPSYLHLLAKNAD